MDELRSADGRAGSPSMPPWLEAFMAAEGIELWGAADLREFATPGDEHGNGFPAAVSWALPMDPEIMSGILAGPNQPYADEYGAANSRINHIAQKLALEIRRRGFRALPLAASDRTDTENTKGDFPHKTAATRAGLGWIGRHCQLVTFEFGPWLRLGTVFTDMDLPCGPPVEQNFCGTCDRCVEACPAGALSGESWLPGIPRESILDVMGCDSWKKEHYFQYHNGHNCGICAAACPFGQKSKRRRQRSS